MSANEIEGILETYFGDVDCELEAILTHCFGVSLRLHSCFHTLTGGQGPTHGTHGCDVVGGRRKGGDLGVMIV